MVISELIKDIMYEENLNQMDFAKKISCTQTQISEWINGNSKPSYDNLQMRGKIFNIDGNKILDLEQKNKKLARKVLTNGEVSCILYLFRFGRLAQLARAPA